jgi:hypothetical protein
LAILYFVCKYNTFLPYNQTFLKLFIIE